MPSSATTAPDSAPRSDVTARKPQTAAAPNGELAWIERIRQRAAVTARGAGALRLGIGDDCAILSPPRGHEIVLTTDMTLEGRHFRRDWHPARAVGHRSLARGLSDLAAMGARPLAAFLSLAIPRAVATEATWMEGFLDGLLALAAATKTPLAGGDTAEAACNDITIDIVLLGATPSGRALRRSGAQPGDRIFVTGDLGGSAAELVTLTSAPKRETSKASTKTANNSDHPHLYPQPRLAAGQSILRRRLASACIDLSDGLSTDLAHLCIASGVAAEIESAKLPLHRLTRTQPPEAALHNALHGGEDYELLFTAPPSASVPRAIAGVALTQIGEIRRAGRNRPLMTLIAPDGSRAPPRARRMGAPPLTSPGPTPPTVASSAAFSATWRAEILPTPPLIAPALQFTWPQRVPGEEDTLARGALLLQIHPASGGTFLATCALGFRDPNALTGVWSCPRADDILAVAGGYAYLADTLAPERCTFVTPKPVVRVLPATEHNLLLLAGFHTIAAIGPDGPAWETARLTWEGLSLSGIRDNQLHGYGWDMRTDREVPFVVDLATGHHTGGGFSA